MKRSKGLALIGFLLLVTSTVLNVPLAVSGPAAAPVASGDDRPTVEVLQSTPEGLLLDVDVAGLTSTEVDQEGTTYTRLRLPYSGATSWLGHPELPTFGRLIALPRGAKVEVEVLAATSEVVPDILVYPAQEPQHDCAGMADDAPFTIDDEFYGEDVVFPGPLAAVDEVKGLRGVEVTVLRFFPLQYNPARRELTVYSHLRVQVRFVGGEGAFATPRYRAESFEEIYSRLLLNYDQLGESPARRAPQSPNGAVFLIITHPNYVGPADDLAAWRNSQGIDTEVRTTDETGSTAAEIQAYIQDAYDTWDPAPEYVLLVGDHELMPTNYSGDTATDLYYYTVDGSDYYPDIHGGRISVDSLAEAEKTINDIIDYDRDPVTDPVFYDNVSVAAYFQDDDLNDYEDRRFVRTSEEIRDYLMSQDYTVERIYVTEPEVNPTHYNNGYYGNGEPLPDDLLRPGFAWDGDDEDITNAVHAGRFILNHRDHGFPGGWGDPYYDVGDVLALTNGNLLPVVFSMNCSSGEFDGGTDPCFAEAWQRNPNGGAVGVVAASRSSLSGYNDWMCNGIYDAIWPEYLPEEIPGYERPERHMAAALNYGKLIMTITWGDPWGYQQYEFELFHWFGDPTTQIHIFPPFPDYTLAVDPDTLEVCPPAVVTSTIQIGQVLTYTEDVALTVLNVPAGVTADIVPPLVAPPGEAVLTLDLDGTTPAGDYTLVVSGTAEITNVHTAEIDLRVHDGLPGVPDLLTPPDGAVGVSLRPDFTWTAVDQATSYDLEVATDSGFGTIVYTATTGAPEHTLAGSLDPSTLYYWHVRAENSCGQGDFSAVFSFTTRATPPILLVDDDDNDPDVREYYTATLDTLGVDYDVWDTGGSDDEPDAAALAPYQTVVWFTGDSFGGSAGPGSNGEAALATFLDQGRCLFISSQDYHYDRGQTAFMSEYLGLDSAVNDEGGYASVTGQGSVFEGLGPYSLGYPFYDYADILTPDGTAEVAFVGDNTNNGAIDKDSGVYRTTFWGFPFEALATAGNREEVMETVLGWCAIVDAAVELTKTVGTDAHSCAPTEAITVPYGAEVAYCYRVENTGGVTLTTHDLEDSELGPILVDFPYDLAPGAGVFVTVTAALTQTTENTAVWTASEPGGASAEGTASALVTVLQPAVELTKTVGTDPHSCAPTEAITVPYGAEVAYCYRVENTGGVTLTTHDLEDSELGPILVDFPYDLAPGAGVFVTATVALTQTTENTATWTASEPGGASAEAADTALVTVPPPSIELTKTVGTDPHGCATTEAITVPYGAEVAYCYRVENTGKVTVTRHELEDSELGPILVGFAYDLGPGADVFVTATALLTQTTANTATWTAYNPGGPSAEAVDTALVTVLPPPPVAIELTKTVGTDPHGCAATGAITVPYGAEVAYCYRVENTGGVTLTLHDLEDSELGVILPGFAYDLGPGADVFVTATALLTQTTANTATWMAYNPGGPSAEAVDTALVTVLPEPPVAIELTKTVGTDAHSCAPTEAITVPYGAEVAYCYRVENAGGVTLTLHDLEDSELGVILSGFAYDLGPEADVFVTATALLTQTTANTATWTAYNPGGPSAEAVDTVLVTVLPPPPVAIELTKTVGTDPHGCAATGAITVPYGTKVAYCYRVENAGGVTLTLHDLEDSELGPILVGFAYDLAPGADVFVTATAALTQTTANTATWTAYNGADLEARASAAATVNVEADHDFLIYLPLVVKSYGP